MEMEIDELPVWTPPRLPHIVPQREDIEEMIEKARQEVENSSSGNISSSEPYSWCYPSRCSACNDHDS